MGPDVKFLRRSSGANFSVKIANFVVEIANYKVVKGMTFLVELLQVHIENLDMFFVARCWSVSDEDSQSWCWTTSSHPQTSDSGRKLFERVDVLCHTRVDEDANSTNTSTVACSLEQFFSSFIYGVERVTSSRLGQSDDVVLDLLGLHYQIFDGRFRCKRTCVISTDRHPSPFPFR
ncbi:hypothetical protein RB195_022750 [Necator americanus]|uniref:Uncharacterized protein n=1 Tax=Necator americanus TaxID=51031 RepID=A0ABR1EGF8_NECAM